jgi:hypothetical protein
MADLFLSYAREDRECAQLLAKALEERGWTVWWDRAVRVGQAFSDVIERELDGAKCVIVLWSPYSSASDWVKNEAAAALERKALVPVRIQDVRPPLEFRRLQTADLFDWRDGFNNPAFDDCITSIEVMVGNTAARPLPSGRFAYVADVVPAPLPQPQPEAAADTAVRTYLGHAVAATVIGIVLAFFSLGISALCSLPFAIAALVQSSRVRQKLRTGDVAEAVPASEKAKQFSLIAFVAAIGSSLIAMVVMALLAARA